MRNLISLPTIGAGISEFQHHHHHYHQQPDAAPPCTVQELSAADYDLDTLKKLKLGIRSSLWSRPNANSAKGNAANETSAGNPLRRAGEACSNPTDYSIAVWKYWAAEIKTTMIWAIFPGFCLQKSVHFVLYKYSNARTIILLTDSTCVIWRSGKQSDLVLETFVFKFQLNVFDQITQALRAKRTCVTAN